MGRIAWPAVWILTCLSAAKSLASSWTPLFAASHQYTADLDADAPSICVSPITGLAWIVVVSRMLLTRSPALRAGW